MRGPRPTAYDLAYGGGGTYIQVTDGKIEYIVTPKQFNEIYKGAINRQLEHEFKFDVETNTQNYHDAGGSVAKQIATDITCKVTVRADPTGDIASQEVVRLLRDIIDNGVKKPMA